MHRVCSINLARLPQLRDALAAWVKDCSRRFGLDSVYLYGSFARGTPHEGSDIDLILIGPFAGKMPGRIVRFLETTDLPIQPLCFTPSEWQALVEHGNPLAQEVLRSGRKLFP